MSLHIDMQAIWFQRVWTRECRLRGVGVYSAAPYGAVAHVGPRPTGRPLRNHCSKAKYRNEASHTNLREEVSCTYKSYVYILSTLGGAEPPEARPRRWLHLRGWAPSFPPTTQSQAKARPGMSCPNRSPAQGLFSLLFGRQRFVRGSC